MAPSSRRTLYLHVGAHRTGTTSIQDFLFANRKALQARGYWLAYARRRHFDLVEGLFAGTVQVADVAADLTARADAKDHAIEAIVLSEERICTHANPEVLAAFAEHFDVQVIYTLRRQDLWLESWYFQNIKWQWTPELSHCTFPEFMAQRETFHWIDYETYVGKLEAAFGAENVQLTVFEKGQMPGGPVGAFCAAIGLKDLEGMRTPPHVNASVSAETLAVMRHLPLDTFEPPVRDVLCRAIEALDQRDIAPGTEGGTRLMTPSERAEVMAAYAPGNAALAARRFERDALFLDPLPPAEAPLANMTLPEDGAALLTRFVGPLLQDLAARGALTATPVTATPVTSPRAKGKSAP